MNPKNGMRPAHPGEILKEDFLKPVGITANALAKALRVPAPRINSPAASRHHSRHSDATGPLFRGRCPVLAEPADDP